MRWSPFHLPGRPGEEPGRRPSEAHPLDALTLIWLAGGGGVLAAIFVWFG